MVVSEDEDAGSNRVFDLAAISIHTTVYLSLTARHINKTAGIEDKVKLRASDTAVIDFQLITIDARIMSYVMLISHVADGMSQVWIDTAPTDLSLFGEAERGGETLFQ